MTDAHCVRKTFFLVSITALSLSVTRCKTSSPMASAVKAESQVSQVKIEPEFYPIAGPTDAIFRNRKITQNYYFGAEALNKILNRNQSSGIFYANWLHFGIWGSMRAGESIDGTDLQLASTTKDFLFDYLEQTLAWLPYRVSTQYIENIKKDRELILTLDKIVKQALAGGNQRVAEEIMGTTDRYIRMLGCENELNQQNLVKFLDTFEYAARRDSPFSELWSNLLEELPSLSKGKMHNYGQDALALAFATYHKSRYESDQTTRAQMIHYANLLIAIHEQLVLQTYISGAIGILDPASPIYRKVATIFAMDLGIPDKGFTGVSKMGTGLVRYPLRKSLPPSDFDEKLKQYTWPPLIDLAKITGLDVSSGRGATDWQDYVSRVYFIAGLMRTMQSNTAIASFPFAGPHAQVDVACQ